MGGRLIQAILAVFSALSGPVGRGAFATLVGIITQLGIAIGITSGARETGDYKAIELELRNARYPAWAFVAGGVAYINAAFQALSRAFQVPFGAAERQWQRQYNAAVTDVKASAADVVSLRTQNIIDDATYRQRMAEYGFSAAEADLLYRNEGTIPSTGQLLELLNRQDGNEIRGTRKYTEDYIRALLLKSPIKDELIDDILELRYSLLGASDYIRFAVKDAYTKDPALAETLAEDFPEVLRPKLTALGLNPDDAIAAWRAHWDLPSPTQVFEMLHRGVLPPGDPDTVVSDYLRQADYDPRWRAPLKAISYNPITRTDAKRAYKLGLGGFDEARLKRAYMDLGYTPTDADTLVAFTKLDVGEEARAERELLVGPVRTQALNLYRTRRITEAELRQTLANLKYPSDLVDRYVADIEFTRQADLREDIASALKSAYVKALRSEDDTRQALLNAGYTGDGADEVLLTWRPLREATELQPHQAAERDLTRAEVVAAYADTIIDRTEALTALMAMGYDSNEAETILRMADLKAARAQQAEDIENVHLNYLRFAYDDASASAALTTLGVGTIKVRNLVLKWAREREKATPDFSLAILENLVKSKVMPEDVAQGYLAAQGWTSEQQMYLLMYWLGRRTPPREA
jgi:SOS response regulatory protein OraA/RecX